MTVKIVPRNWLRNPAMKLSWANIRSIWFRPRQTLRRLLDEPGTTFRLPLVILTLFAAAHVIAAAPLLRAEVQSNPPPLPQDFQYYPPATQEQYMRAVEVTSGAAFIYIFPFAQAALRIWLGWLIVGGMLYATLTIFGARSNFSSMLTLSAASGLPYLVKDAVQIGYMLLARQLIRQPGLSAFGPQEGASLSLFWTKALESVDIYLIWQALILAVGLGVLLPNRRGLRWLALVLVIVVAVVLQALPGFLGQRLSSMTVIRPYF